MTSSRDAAECFVYITLPGETQFVTAGRFEIATDRHGSAIGRFVYGRKYLDRPDAVTIDPVELILSRRAFETGRMKGVFGGIRDAGPDHWGRRVIERHGDAGALSEIDYLLLSADDRAGALGFGRGPIPPAPRRDFNQTLHLEKLQSIADTMAADDESVPSSATAIQISELMLVGTSMGGARPKAVVEDEQGLWLAKFNHPRDRWNNARVEHAMLVLARHCGLIACESQVVRVAGRDVLLVKRFDRAKTATGYRRARMISALTLLRAEDSHRSRELWSYPLLVEEVRRVCSAPRNDAHELFRRMCFNALISNTDDHPRNHAIIALDHEWKLSPAYDLTPAAPVSLERRDLALTCGDWGRYANATNLLSQGPRFLLEAAEAAKIVDDMQAQVTKEWFAVARGAGVSERDCDAIRGAFAYPGFRLSPQA
jgi:serine/threonine-protein kinase HipA